MLRIRKNLTLFAWLVNGDGEIRTRDLLIPNQESSGHHSNVETVKTKLDYVPDGYKFRRKEGKSWESEVFKSFFDFDFFLNCNPLGGLRFGTALRHMFRISLQKSFSLIGVQAVTEDAPHIDVGLRVNVH